MVFGAVLLSFGWNIFLLVGVILNNGFVHTRAAGGQFTDFPAPAVSTGHISSLDIQTNFPHRTN